jgi:DNA-binding response OmpR family regulator
MTEPSRILIADDEEVYRESMADLVRARGNRCDCAPDGAIAGEMLREMEYDLLVSDLQMPGNEHLDLLQSLSSLPQPPAVLIVTGHPSLDTAIESHRFDVVGYLVKPVNLDEFFACLDRGVSRGQRRRLVHGTRLRVQQLADDLGQIERISRDDGDAIATDRVFLELTLANIRGSLQDLSRLSPVPVGSPGEAGAPPTAPEVSPHRPAELERAIKDAITVLERTKNAFKSKDLGDLRRGLEAVLRQETTSQHEESRVRPTPP